MRCSDESKLVVKHRQGADVQKNAVEEFLERILKVEKKLRERLKTQAEIAMTSCDWSNFRNAQNCHICNKSLRKPEFLDSVGVWDRDMGKYCMQSHKKCYWGALCTNV